jgi:ABC-2 type transport system permease protein
MKKKLKNLSVNQSVLFTISFDAMWMICQKEWKQFFSTITGYLAIGLFLLLNGLFLFVFNTDNLFSFGYASLTPFFNKTPFLLLFLVPVITMRSFAEEFKTGTFELLRTWPITPYQLVMGKFLGAAMVVLAALLPTIIYAVCLQQLSTQNGIDIGSTIGSYMGLFLLGITFTAIGIATSSFTNNTVIAFILGAFVCFVFYTGFEAVAAITGSAGYYIEMLGISHHYKSISRGVVDVKDLLYFISLIALFMLITQRNLVQRT